MSGSSLLQLTSLITLIVMGVVLVVAMVLTALMARGHARWLGALGFGLFLVRQLVLGPIAAALGLDIADTLVVGLLLGVGGAVCVGLAIVLGFRAARRTATAGAGSRGPVPPPFPGQPS